jgi:predicted lactoylglutathione lyase
MLVGEDAYFMLLDREKFGGFAKRPQGNPQDETNSLFAISLNSREEVDAIVRRAIDAGGSAAGEPFDHGFMYGWSFYDVDGYHWEVFYMDPAAVNG